MIISDTYNLIYSSMTFKKSRNVQKIPFLLPILEPFFIQDFKKLNVTNKLFYKFSKSPQTSLEILMEMHKTNLQTILLQTI